jgi:hypothetical protein
MLTPRKFRQRVPSLDIRCAASVMNAMKCPLIISESIAVSFHVPGEMRGGILSSGLPHL